MNLFGIIILFAAYAINRFVMTNAAKNLTDQDKLKIFGSFSKRNNLSTVLVLMLVIIYFGAVEYLPHFIIQTTAVYLTIFIAYLLFRFVSNYKKLKQLAMPDSYIKSFIISYGIFILGFLAMTFCVFWNWTL